MSGDIATHHFTRETTKLGASLFDALIERMTTLPAVVIRVPHSRGEKRSSEDNSRAKDWPTPAQVTFHITTLTSRKFSLTFDNTDSIFDVKLAIQNLEGIPPEQQRLIYDGKQFSNEDDDCLYQLGFAGGEYKVTLVLRLRGGMYHGTSGHSGIYKSFPLDVFFQHRGKDIAITIQVHGGNTFEELIKTIMEAAAYGHWSIDGTAVHINTVPLHSAHPEKETLDSIGLSAEKMSSGFPTIRLVQMSIVS